MNSNMAHTFKSASLENNFPYLATTSNKTNSSPTLSSIMKEIAAAVSGNMPSNQTISAGPAIIIPDYLRPFLPILIIIPVVESLKQYGFHIGYENGDFLNGYEWGKNQAVSPDRLVASGQQPHMEGKRSLRVTVFPTTV
jgi:hypothetical protein